jgi:isopentenyl-diphosphate Delta-isomerase
MIPLAFSCYVFTTDGRLLLTMRGYQKTTWPGMWTSTCHGHPAPGEPVSHAVARTLRDELGLPAAVAELVLPACRYRLPGHGSEVCRIYRVVTDQPPRPDPREVGDFEWVGWADFVDAVSIGDISLSPWCPPQVAALSALGADPTRWPAVDAEEPAA